MFALLLLLLSAFTPVAARAEGRAYGEMTGGYARGDFGTPFRFHEYLFTTAVGYVAPRYDFRVSAQYLFLSVEGAGIRERESGVGDVVVSGGRVFLTEGRRSPSLSGSLAVKLPTADEDKGLGSGEADYGAFLSARRRMGAFKLSLTGGYIYNGDPPGRNYNNTALYEAGISRVLGNTDILASYEARRALVTGNQNPRLISLRLFHVLNRDYAVKVRAFTGLNDGDWRFGTTAGLVRWF